MFRIKKSSSVCMLTFKKQYKMKKSESQSNKMLKQLDVLEKKTKNNFAKTLRLINSQRKKILTVINKKD